MSELKACPDGGHCNNEDIIDALKSQLTEAEKRNDLFSDCLKRARKLWQKRHPHYKGWPDGAKSIAFVFDTLTKLQEDYGELSDEFKQGVVALATAQEEITASRNFIEDILGNATKAQLRSIKPFLVKYRAALNGGKNE